MESSQWGGEGCAGAVVDAGDKVASHHRWTAGRLSLVFSAEEGRPVVLCGLGTDQEPAEPAASTQPLVELMLTGEGRARNNTRFTNTGAGSRLRYAGHVAHSLSDEEWLEIVQTDDATGLRVVTAFRASPEVQGARITTTVHNDGALPVVLEAVSSAAVGALVRAGESTEDLVLHWGTGEQLAENRWTAQPLWSQTGLGDFNSALMNQPGRGSFAAVGTSTWSTARALPTGALVNSGTGRALAWQVEHNGGWRWEVDNVRVGEDSAALVLLGPEDLDHHWSQELAPGASFTTVPVSIAVADGGFEAAVAELTLHRRWLRRARTADRGSLLVFNDYMNTLNGNPTTERLLPLIEHAARAGAECFCIDAGWYDDTAGDWWPTVGEWIPSIRRFPDGGLARVVQAIRGQGMKVGLWLEPEVVGVHSPVTARLPDEAFLQRHGRRVTEHERFFLDLRSPHARAHLDAAFDRLIADFGVGFFKLDYNVTPGPGTDAGAFSVGAGLLGHNRAHLEWFAGLRRRHPEVVFENCSSGGMRADFAMLELFDFQSTSDQEDFRLYPAIAAGAPIQMLPEQAGNWAYPQAWMSQEEIAYTMATGLSGRLYLSGFLNRMDPDQLELVHTATALFKQVRDDIAQSVPSWPAGMPQWYGDSLALQLGARGRTLLYAWHRGTDDDEIALRLPRGVRAQHLAEVYPQRLSSWELADAPDGSVVLRPGIDGPSARIFEIQTP
ncbi:glycoside hydrolase family 36 protein [Sinomonas sp. P47F7]|uniref:glycoside hydrolase family 36 protein n=1 Tax=Sinomonas sp. P47F7 TaxID=3410987 RepID=UPI003BF48358